MKFDEKIALETTLHCLFTQMQTYKEQRPNESESLTFDLFGYNGERPQNMRKVGNYINSISRFRKTSPQRFISEMFEGNPDSGTIVERLYSGMYSQTLFLRQCSSGFITPNSELDRERKKLGIF